MVPQNQYHIPVMLNECLDGLAINPNCKYLDCTLGGGGHFSEIVNRLHNSCTAIGIDRDLDSIKCVRGNLQNSKCQVIIEQCKFSEFDSVLKKHSIESLDGVLLDLGVSSFQIDNENRGFSYRVNSNLDMRMNQNDSLTAEDIINTSGKEKLTTILSKYGEIKNPKRMATTIENYSKTHTIKTSKDLCTCLEMEYGSPIKYKVLSKVFQALRIAINNELEELRICLSKIIQYLNKGGRLVVISYHSLEDRIVKQFIKENETKCVCPPHLPICSCDTIPVLKRINRKVKRASSFEIEKNNRARSARLRIAEKI